MSTRRRILAVLGMAVLACAGIGAAVAATETTGTVSICATATVPAHTVALDGVNVATLPGDFSSQCATTTYTVPTVTETVTVGTTTAPTTTPTGSPTFATATAYTQNRPAFTPAREIDVTTGAQLKTAVANLQPGDLVKATAGFTLNGSSGNTLVVANRLSAPAVIDLAATKIVYSGTGNFSAVWVKNAQNVRIYGGDLSTSDIGGACITWYGSQHVTWWGFKAHDCGGSGIGVANAKPGYSYAGPVSYDDIEGEIWKFGQHSAWDNHVEKCTGLQGANLSDTNTDSFDHNRFAFNIHDSACEGAGIEFGTSQTSPLPNANTIILQCDSLTFVSMIQTGGNCYQAWGYGTLNTDIKYLHATNLQGHPYFAGGMYGKAGAALSSNMIEYGRASSVRLNVRYVGDPNYDPKAGTVFGDVAPLP